jgi:hypothetical protein
MEVSMRRTPLALLVCLATLAGPIGASTADAQEAAPPMDRATADVQLEAMRHDLGEVEDGLFRVREALMLMTVRGVSETGAARLVLTFEDHFVGLTPTSATFSLDGTPIFATTVAARIEAGAIYQGPIPSGPHVLTLALDYQGDVLYTTGYRVHIDSSETFTTEMGETVRVRVIGHDEGPLVPLEDRATVDYVVATDPRAD